MRIGKFAEHNNLSIDTIRYYVDLNLIHPIRRGKYFYFEKEQQEELNKLLYLKNLKFTLEEIKKIVTVQGFSKIKTTIESSIYHEMLLKKRDDLSSEISELSIALRELEGEIGRVKERHNDTYKERGIAFNNLELICCPKCGKPIEISEGILKGRGIYEGKSECECGYSLSINQGIIITKHNCSDIIGPYVDGHNYVDDFVNEAPKKYVDFMMNSSKEVVRLLLEKELSNKVLLFMRSGFGLLETDLLEQSQYIKLMILVDDDFNKLRVAKKSIESNFPGCNVIYICSELYELPIKKKTVDIAVDFLATFIDGFRLDHNMYEYIIPMLKEKSSIVGLYLYFKHFKMLSRLPESQRKLFDGRTISKTIKGLNFVETSDYEETILHEGININDFFREGDNVHSKIMVFDRRE